MRLIFTDMSLSNDLVEDKMKNILQKYTEKIATDRAEALNTLSSCYLESIKQINDNPFIRTKWNWLDRWFYKRSLGYVPKTPSEQMKDRLDELYANDRQQIEKNTNEYIKALGSYKAPKTTKREGKGK